MTAIKPRQNLAASRVFYFIINRPKTVAIKAVGGCINKGDHNTGLQCIKHKTDSEFPLGLVKKMQDYNIHV